jgi:5-deoxy-glucuronate isomerase
MHIAPYDNQNRPIVDVDDAHVPLTYFNIVKLKAGEHFDYRVPGYETCVVPATGTVTVEVGAKPLPGSATAASMSGTGSRKASTCPPTPARITALTIPKPSSQARNSPNAEPFAVRKDDLDLVQYGSDDTKTHRKIKHILGAGHHDRVGRLLVSELFTVGRGAGPAFPATSTTPTVCRMRHGMTSATTSASSPTTDRVSRCSSARTTNPATPITSSMVRRSDRQGLSPLLRAAGL